MEVNGVAVMKRRSDSWLNATQILKVAGVVKARRTKTLEKEIAAGEHEKVQGGYGKYQGTWVKYQRGVDLCREYHVEELLRPLLEYDMGSNGTGGSMRDHLDTPTKEQAMAAQRKRLYSGMENRGMSQPQQGTFFQNISRTAATAVNAMSKARFDSPAARGADSRRSSVVRKPSTQMNSQESQMPFGSQQSMYSVTSDSGFGSNFQANGNGRTPHDHIGFEHEDSIEPPRKRMRSSSHQVPSFGMQYEPASLSMNEPTPTEPNDSFYQDMDVPTSVVMDGDKTGHEPLAPATTPERFQKMKLIMTLFLDKRTKDFTTHPALMQLTGEDLEIPLDEYRNNALHWAAMLARMPLVHALVAKGVSIFRLNGAGETALQKSVGTRNNLDYRSFPRLLQILAPTIDTVDYSGRTILHHIAVMAATGGGGHVSAKHYLEALLEFIVRHGGTSQQTPNGTQENGQSVPPAGEVITLGRFVSEIVNLRDDQGDTALNLAGRARSVLVPQLLEVGADPHIPNHTGLRPADYGVGVDMVDGNGQCQQSANRDSFMDQLAKTKKEILDGKTSWELASSFWYTDDIPSNIGSTQLDGPRDVRRHRQGPRHEFSEEAREIQPLARQNPRDRQGTPNRAAPARRAQAPELRSHRTQPPAQEPRAVIRRPTPNTKRDPRRHLQPNENHPRRRSRQRLRARRHRVRSDLPRNLRSSRRIHRATSGLPKLPPTPRDSPAIHARLLQRKRQHPHRSRAAQIQKRRPRPELPPHGHGLYRLVRGAGGRCGRGINAVR